MSRSSFPQVTATVSPPAVAMQSNDSVSVKIALTGTSPWYLAWDDGTNQIVNVSPGERTIYGTNVTAPAPPFSIGALRITLRIWDPKSRFTRQVTVIQDM